MSVGVDQPGQHCLALEIENVCVPALQLENLAIGSDAKNSAIFDRNGLADGKPAIYSHNFAVAKDQVGFDARRFGLTTESSQE
jgi:hypothetical protein